MNSATRQADLTEGERGSVIRFGYVGCVINLVMSLTCPSRNCFAENQPRVDLSKSRRTGLPGAVIPNINLGVCAPHKFSANRFVFSFSKAYNHILLIRKVKYADPY